MLRMARSTTQLVYMIRIPNRAASSVRVPKGYIKYVKEIESDSISSNKLLVDELKHISSQKNLKFCKNSFADINSYWFRRTAPHKEVEAEVIDVSKITGFGIARGESINSFITVPFTVPGDRVKVTLGRHYEDYIEGSLVQFTARAPRVEPKCQYFGSCSGCQLQHFSYDEQLNYKKSIIEFAFQNAFQSTEYEKLIKDTVGSPLEFNYRTKLTPHYERMRSTAELKIGLNDVNSGLVDVSRCEISSNIVNEGLKKERERIFKSNPSNGGTLTIRESHEAEIGQIVKTGAKDLIIERIKDKEFQFPIYTFFQNNRSILPILLEFIETHLRENLQLETFVDAYCGSGFFSISLSEFFKQAIGIEISAKSIEYARLNSQLNQLKNISFVSGTASNIFGELGNLDPNKTCILIDPSRKGSHIDFLRQLAGFSPALIIYVSCNVYSQARDLFDFLKVLHMEEIYHVKEIRGFDFFPQTKHVESVAILELKRAV